MPTNELTFRNFWIVASQDRKRLAQRAGGVGDDLSARRFRFGDEKEAAGVCRGRGDAGWGGNAQWNHIYGPDNEDYDRYFYSFQQTSDGGFIAAGSLESGGNESLWLVKTDSSGNISKCAYVLNDSAVTGSIAVTVSNGDLSAVADSFSFVPDSLILSNAPLTATKECE